MLKTHLFGTESVFGRDEAIALSRPGIRRDEGGERKPVEEFVLFQICKRDQ